MERVIPDIIVELGQDHINARRVLNTLERQVDAVAQYRELVPEVAKGAVEFFEDYSMRHHGIEELVLETLAVRMAPDKAEVNAIQREHAEAADKLARFAEAVRYTLPNVDATRHAFCRTAREFIAQERAHIRREETRFFVYALEHLTEEDWIDIDWAVREGVLDRRHEALTDVPNETELEDA